MAKKLFLVDIDLNGNQMKNAVVEVLMTAPSSPQKGQIYLDGTDNKFKYYNGSTWVAGAEYTADNMAEDTPDTQYGVYDSASGTQLKFRVLKTGDPRLKLSMSDGIITASLDMKYQSAMPDELTTPNAIGGIPAGTSAEDLKAKTVDQVLDDILFPEINPTVANPSASLSLKSGFSNNGIYEVGATAPADPTNFTKSFNRGACTAPGQATMYRAGAEQTGSSFIYVGGSESNKVLPLKITLGAMQYNYQAAYTQGDTLKTSKGNKATNDASGRPISQNPLPAGHVNSGTVTIYGTYPYFCNGKQSSANLDTSYPGSATPDTKLTLVKWTETKIYAKFASEASTGTRAEFKFPSTKKVTKVQVMNDLNGSWGDFSDVAVESSAGKMTVQGVQVDYMKITTNGDLHGNLHLCFTVADRG